MAGPIDQFRAQYPGAYDGIPDEVLAERIRKTYYAHEDPAAFWQFVGLRPPQGTLQRYVTDPAVRGAARAGQGLAALGADTGLISPETAAGVIGGAEEMIQARRPSVSTQRALQDISGAPDFMTAAGAALRNPGAVAETAVESAAQSAPGIAAGVAGGMAAGPVGAIAGFGLGAGAVEYMASVQDAWREAGVDPANPQQLAAALQNPEAVAKAREYARARAVPIAAFGLVSGALAGRFIAGAQGARSAAMRGTAELGLQAGLEGAGEATAQLASKGQIQPGDVLLESAAGIPGGVPEIAMGAYNARRQPVVANETAPRETQEPLPVAGETLPGQMAPFGEPPMAPFGTPFYEPRPFEPLPIDPDYVPPPDQWQPSPFADPGEESYDFVPMPEPKQAILPVPMTGPLAEALKTNIAKQAIAGAMPMPGDLVASPMAQPRSVDPMARAMSGPVGFPPVPQTQAPKPPRTDFVRRVEPQPAPEAPQGQGEELRAKIAEALQTQPFDPATRKQLVDTLRTLNRPPAVGDVVQQSGRQVEILALPPPDAKSGVVKAQEIATGRALSWPSLPAFMRGVKAEEAQNPILRPETANSAAPAALPEPDARTVIEPPAPMQKPAGKSTGSNFQPEPEIIAPPATISGAAEAKSTASAPKIARNRDTISSRPLADFLASTGGINIADRRETRMEGEQWLIPKAGPLWRKAAKSLDYARERAVEAGYLRGDATVEDLIRALNKDRAAWKAKDPTGRVYAGGESVVDTKEADRDAERVAEVEAYSRENGYELTPREMRSIAETMATEGMDVSDAVDRFVENDMASVDAEMVDAGELEGDAPPLGDERPQAEGAGATGEGGTRGQERAPVAVTEEPGAEGRPQLVLPGMERSAKQAKAARDAAGPRKGQKPADEGLFAPREKEQGEIQYAVSRPTSAFARDRSTIVAEATKLAKRINPAVRVEAVDGIFDVDAAAFARSGGGQGMQVVGSFDPSRSLIRVALGQDDKGIIGVAAHESWHAIEKLVPERDMRLLREAFPASGARSQNEEIAYAFQDHVNGKPRGSVTVRGIFGRVREFIKNLGNLLRGKGFRSVESVFEDAIAGKFAPKMQAVDVKGTKVWGIPLGKGGYAIKAYHGSPHRFDKFSMDKIGTGEGAQAYGHGLYFAESQEVAKGYKKALSDGVGNTQTPLGAADRALQMAGGNVEQAIKNIEAEIEAINKAVRRMEDKGIPVPDAFRDRVTKEYLPAIWAIEDGYRPGGALYTTTLDVEPEDLLDWDKPLSEQSPKVREALEKLRPMRENAAKAEEASGTRVAKQNADSLRSDTIKAGDFYRMIMREGRPWGIDNRSITEALRAAGIPGIRYLDAGSRSSGDGSRNIVMFDDSLIRIDDVQYAVRRRGKISETQAAFLRGYKEDDYRWVNKYLQDGKLGSDKDRDVYIRKLDAAINKGEIDRDTTVYRGMRWPESFGSPEDSVGKTISLPSYTSVSTNPDVAGSFAGLGSNGVKLVIDIPAGTRGVETADYETTNNSGESEILLPRDGMLAIDRVEQDGRQKVIYGRWMSADVQYAVAPTSKPNWIYASEPDGVMDRIREGGLLRRARDWWFSEGLTQLVDRFQPVLQAGRRVMPVDPGYMHRLVEMAANDGGAVQAVMEAGAPQLNKDTLAMELAPGSEGLAPIMTRHLLGKPNSEERQNDAYKAGAYRYAQRAKRLMAEGRERLLSDADIAKALDVTKAERERYDAMWADYDKHNRAVLKFAEDAGVIAPGTADQWSAYGDYVPFYRVMEDEGELVGPKEYYSGLSNPDPKIKKLKGGTSKLGDPYENIARNERALISAARRNVALQAVAKVLTKAEEARVVPMTGDSKSSILLFENGQKKRLQVDDPAVAASLVTLGPQQTNGIMKFLQTFAQIYRAGVTLTPSFVIANMLRDIPSSYIQTGASISARHNAITEMARLYKGTSSINDVKAMTGFGGTQYSSEGSLFQPTLAEVVGTKRTGAFKTAARKIHDRLEALSQATEWANRLAIYDNLVAKGVPKERAAYESMNVINYGRRGASPAVQALVQLVPFLNARIQGLSRMFETQSAGFGSVERKKLLQQLVMRGLVLSAASAAIFAGYDDEDWAKYDEESLEKRAGYHIIYTGDTPILIPKAFEWGTIFSTMPETLIRAINGKHEGELAKVITHTLVNTFAFNPIPQAILPALEAVVNFDLFRMRDLEPQYLQRFMPQERVFPTTSPTAAALARALPGDISPIKVQHLVEGYGGAAANAMLFAIDGALGSMGALPEAPAGVFGDGIAAKLLQPILGRFVRDGEVAPAEVSIQKLYDIKRKAEQAYATANELMRRGEVERARELMTENARPIAMRKQLDRTTDMLADLTKQARQVRMSPTMSADEKRRRINELTTRKNALARQQVVALNRAA